MINYSALDDCILMSFFVLIGEVVQINTKKYQKKLKKYF